MPAKSSAAKYLHKLRCQTSWHQAAMASNEHDFVITCWWKCSEIFGPLPPSNSALWAQEVRHTCSLTKVAVAGVIHTAAVLGDPITLIFGNAATWFPKTPPALPRSMVQRQLVNTNFSQSRGMTDGSRSHKGSSCSSNEPTHLFFFGG